MKTRKIIGVGAFSVIAIVGLIIGLTPISFFNHYTEGSIEFPDFYTKTEDYFITRIGAVPEIDENIYELKITGCIENPRNYTLSELQTLPLIHFPLTIETIGNPYFGLLVSTANWTGFSVFALLSSLGITSNATGVKYYAADGYYATHTMGQLMNNTVIGAIYINNQTLPPIQGFPLRIINPGYYGAKQPAWVTEIEVIDMPLNDYWDDRGWDTSPRMHIDSKIFFPANYISVRDGNSIFIGGTAYGGRRVLKVEYTLNNGFDWYPAEIIKSIDVDYVWVFWLIKISMSGRGLKTLHMRATDIYNRTQPRIDPTKRDGENSWPYLNIQVI